MEDYTIINAKVDLPSDTFSDSKRWLRWCVFICVHISYIENVFHLHLHLNRCSFFTVQVYLGLVGWVIPSMVVGNRRGITGY